MFHWINKMALQFDGNGQVNIPEFLSVGDFTVSGTVTLGSTNTEIWCGYSAASTNFIGYVAGISGIRARINGTDFDSGVSVTVGQTITFSLSRTGSSVTFTVNGSDVSGSEAGAFRIDRLGSFNGGSGKYTGLMSGILTMTGSGGLSRTYDTETSTGTTLTDTTLSQDGTLTGFTTGGFVSGDSISVTTQEYRIWQRTDSDDASVTLDGTYSGTVTNIERSVDGGSYVVAVSSPSGGVFSDTFTLSTGQHSITYRFSNDTGVNDNLNFIAVGDIFACAGQSNLSGRGTNNQVFSNSAGGVTAYLFGNDDNYKQLADPFDSDTNQVDSVSSDATAAGSWVPRFANAWLADSEVPIGFIPCAKGGSTISEWSRDTSASTLYGSMKRRLDSVGDVKAVLWEQGESDSLTSSPTPGATYQAALEQLATDINNDFGVDTFVIPLHTITAAGYTNQATIRQAQLDAAEASNNIRIGQPLTDIDLSGGDGLHFQSDSELNTVATRMYSSYTSILIEGQTTSISYSAVNGSVSFESGISVIGSTPNVTYSAVNGSAIIGRFSPVVNFSGTIKQSSFSGVRK